MEKASMIGLDIAKNAFEVHGRSAAGEVVLRRRLRRGQVEKLFAKLAPAVIGLEACGSAHHWARVLGKHGHQVRLMPPAYVKPYVKRNKSDAIDAAACWEAVGRPDMRFVPVKTVEQQAALSLHPTPALLPRQPPHPAGPPAGSLALQERPGLRRLAWPDAAAQRHRR